MALAGVGRQCPGQRLHRAAQMVAGQAYALGVPVLPEVKVILARSSVARAPATPVRVRRSRSA